MQKIIVGKISKNGRKEVPPYKMDEHNNFSLSGTVFDWVKVKCEDKKIQLL